MLELPAFGVFLYFFHGVLMVIAVVAFLAKIVILALRAVVSGSPDRSHFTFITAVVLVNHHGVNL